MKDPVKKHLHIEKDLEKEIKEIEEIVRSKENNAVKIDSLRAILNEMMDEIIEARIQSVIDDVTGFVTQKFFNDYLEKEIEEARRYDKKLSLVAIDIDFLKYINDNHGHVLGTHVIEKVAEIIKKNARKPDIVSRYGGDEFMIICPNTSLRGVKILANRIKKEVEVQTFSENVKTSVSIGVGEYADHYNYKKFIDIVDKAMYKAKQNRVNLNLKN